MVWNDYDLGLVAGSGSRGLIRHMRRDWLENSEAKDQGDSGGPPEQ